MAKGIGREGFDANLFSREPASWPAATGAPDDRAVAKVSEVGQWTIRLRLG